MHYKQRTLFDIMEEQTVNKENNAVTTTSPVATTFNDINLFNATELAEAENFLKRMVSTDKGGIKNVNEGLAILMRAKDLNLPFSTCIEHIHVINGKTGLDVHIIRSLLSRAGVTWECTKDYAPQYQYTDGNTIYLETQLPEYCVKCKSIKEAEAKSVDGLVGVYPLAFYQGLDGNIFNEFQINDKCVKCINKIQAMNVAKEGKYPLLRIPAIPIDYVTEYKFTRYKQILGEKVVTTAVGKYSYKDAESAELLNKDNYKKHPRIMVGIRAFTLGAREIADDIIMGCMETTELKIITDTPISENDFVEAQVIE